MQAHRPTLKTFQLINQKIAQVAPPFPNFRGGFHTLNDRWSCFPPPPQTVQERAGREAFAVATSLHGPSPPARSSALFELFQRPVPWCEVRHMAMRVMDLHYVSMRKPTDNSNNLLIIKRVNFSLRLRAAMLIKQCECVDRHL